MVGAHCMCPNSRVILNVYGKIVENELLKTKEMRKNIQINHYVIMPNHIHSLIEIYQRKIREINIKYNSNHKFNRGNYIDQNFQNMNELYFDFSKKNKFIYQFINGLLNGVNADVEDTGNIDDVEKWCKEKINFLKFVEIDK